MVMSLLVLCLSARPGESMPPQGGQQSSVEEAIAIAHADQELSFTSSEVQYLFQYILDLTGADDIYSVGTTDEEQEAILEAIHEDFFLIGKVINETFFFSLKKRHAGKLKKRIIFINNPFFALPQAGLVAWMGSTTRTQSVSVLLPPWKKLRSQRKKRITGRKTKKMMTKTSLPSMI